MFVSPPTRKSKPVSTMLHVMLFVMMVGILTGLNAGRAFAQSGNRLADPAFKTTAELEANPPRDLDRMQLQEQMPWVFHIIERPAEARYAPPRVTLTGGRAFLHSDAFDVTPGDTYRVTLKAGGDGQISAGLLWWRQYTDERIRMAEPHWAQMDEPAQATDKANTVRATFTAPDKAKRAYLRLVVTDGEVTIQDVRVIAVDDAETTGENAKQGDGVKQDESANQNDNAK